MIKLDVSTRQKLVSLLVVVAGVTLAMFALGELFGGPERLKGLVESAGAWAPLAYVAVKALTYVIAPLSGASLEITAGALLGLWPAVILSAVGSTIGGSINYWIAHTLGRAGVIKFAGKKALNQVDETGERLGGWRALIVARVVLSPVYDFVSYAAGLARISFVQYFLVTLIVGLPVNIFFPLLGHASTTSKLISYTIFATIGVVFVVLGVVHLRHRRRAKKAKS